MIYLFKSDKISKLFLNLKNIKEYNDEIKLNDEDIILIIRYWHIHSIKNVIEKGNYQRGLDNVNVQGRNEYIIDNKNKDILNNPQSRLLLFNSWETRDLYVRKDKLKTFVKEYLKLPFNRVFFSTSNYLNHMNLIKSHILSYDWVYLNEKLRFNRKYRLNYKTKKNYRIISLNRRGSYERYYYCCYLFNKLKNKTNFSFINLGGEDFKSYKNYKKLNLINNKEWDYFYNNIPKELDSLNPDFYNNNNNINNISKYLEQAYIQVIFETNSQPMNSNSQQISEKSYMGIRNGQPFILFSTTGGILEHLERLGFKTFHPFINENYDNKNLSYGKFFPKEIYNYIQEYMNYKINFMLKVNNIKINLCY